MTDLREIQARYAEHGQDHVFQFAGTLSGDERRSFAAQLGAIDLDLFATLLPLVAPASDAPPLRAEDIEPVRVVRLPEAVRDDDAVSAGSALLRAGKVAVITVAGGQGTRLGYDGPKGCFEIGPVTNRSLFEIHALKIRRLRDTCGAPVPWYLMTSEANHRPTRAFFETHDWFGLPPGDVTLFVQRMLPAVSADGKMLLDAPGRLATSPDGHGGTIRALAASGCLADMRARGIEQAFYFQVDNPMVRIADPAFLGHHARAGAEMSSKVVRKRDWAEPVGLICRRHGTLDVVEYSELPDDVAQIAEPDGSLRYWAGSIAIHALNVGFLERLTVGGSFALPFHAARKKVPYVNADGDRVEPAAANAVKFETFIFDALGLAEESVTVECDRADEFSPVKNLAGEDSVDTCRAALTDQYARWLEAAGARVPRTKEGVVDGALEISPLLAAAPADLTAAHAARFRMSPGESVSLGP